MTGRLTEAVGIEQARVGRRGRAAGELGDQLAGGGAHRHADHRVTGRHHEIVEPPGATDERQPVGGAGTEAAPDLQELEVLPALDAGERLLAERLHAPAVDREVHARKLERAAEPQELTHRRDREAALRRQEGIFGAWVMIER